MASTSTKAREGKAGAELRGILRDIGFYSTNPFTAESSYFDIALHCLEIYINAWKFEDVVNTFSSSECRIHGN